DHYVLCGYGRIGGIIPRGFLRPKNSFVIIHRNPNPLPPAPPHGQLPLQGDARRAETLPRAPIDKGRGWGGAGRPDAGNVYSVLTARVLKPELFVIARAESEDSIAKLKRAGADRVISPYQIGAVQMAQTALRPAVVDFVEIATSSDNLELSMEQVKISDG